MGLVRISRRWIRNQPPVFFVEKNRERCFSAPGTKNGWVAIDFQDDII
jgi:hypothetical protein